MPSISSGRGPITEAMQESSLWTGTAVNSPAAVYLSSGDDSRMLSVTHPENIRAKASDGPVPEPFAFYVHVDRQTPLNRPGLDYDDGRTQITRWDAESLSIGGHHAWFLKLIVRSDRYAERNVAVLRIRATNDEFTELALAEDWKTHCLITVLDGCLNFGGQPGNRCENDITGNRRTNLLKLNPDWLITDHFKRSQLVQGEVPETGDVIEPDDPKHYGLRFKHACALATPRWPGAEQRDRDRYVRLYEVEPTEYWLRKREAERRHG